MRETLAKPREVGPCPQKNLFQASLADLWGGPTWPHPQPSVISRVATLTSLVRCLALQFSTVISPPALPCPPLLASAVPPLLALPQFQHFMWHLVRAQMCLCLTVSHRPGAFKSELSKLVIVAKAARSEL